MSEKLRKIKDRASKAFGEGKLKDALKLYQQAVDEDPTELACRIKIGDIHRRLGSKSQAVSAYEPVARFYAEDGMLLKAIAVCKLILSVDAAHTSTQEMLANLYSARATPAGRPSAGSGSATGRPAGASKGVEIDIDDEEEMVVERNATSLVAGSEARGSETASAAGMFSWPAAQVIVGSKVEPPPAAPSVPVIMGSKVDGPSPKKHDLKKAAEAAADSAAEAVARALAAPPTPVPQAPAPPGPHPGAMWPGAAWPQAPASEPVIEAELIDGSQDIESGEAEMAAASHAAAESVGSEEANARMGADEPLDLGEIDAASPPLQAPAIPSVPAASQVIVAETDSSTLEQIFDGIENNTPVGGLAARAPAGIADRPDDDVQPIELAKVSRPATSLAGDLARPQIPLFSDLPKDAFIEILVQMTMREMSPGEYVITEGEVGNSFFVLAQGKVRVSRKNDDGSETVLAYLTDGAFFGEMALLQDGARTASVIVEEDSQIFELSKPVLDAVVAQYPTVARILRNFYTQRLLSTAMATHVLFKSFGPNERRELMELFKSKPFKAGEILVEEGKKGEGLYILLSGTLEVTRIRNGSPFTIAELVPGDMFGEISLLTNKPTVATVRALTDCFVLRLSKKNFDEVIMTHPQVLELVSQISDERQTENSAIFGNWPRKVEGGVALV
jgi:CRP-like cAMP-binding protein